MILNALCFHPFQGRAPFGRFVYVDADDFKPELVSIPFREELHSDLTVEKSQRSGSTRTFPSLSGKSSIRTKTGRPGCHFPVADVSIPFREELHSDSKLPGVTQVTLFLVSIPFREELHSDLPYSGRSGLWAGCRFHPFQGRAPFGQTGNQEDMGSRRRPSFHPFQGRAPFGPWFHLVLIEDLFEQFPSLSGKSSIRTYSIRTQSLGKIRSVSIPFREELHSDASDTQVQKIGQK